MKRRDFVSSAALASAALVIRPATVIRRRLGPIHYEIHGNPNGKPLFLGFPIFASYGDIFGAEAAPVLSGFLDRLTDRYRVLVVDYPNVGKTYTPPPGEMTADRVCADLLAVTTEAGFERFAYWGYAWGASVGLQLASRTDRLSALVIGGWTPLGGQYAEMLAAAEASVPNPSPGSMKVLRDKNQYTQWVTFYQSVLNWPEAGSVARIKCPRMAFAGAESNAIVHYSATLRARRKELEDMGWYVTEIPGRGHDVGLDPAAVVPVVRAFLDQAL